jgi:putative DNA primase/helicase
MIPLDLRAIARALGGNVWGRNVVAPGPGHSRTDRSLSIKIEPNAADGFLVHSFANDSPIACRDYVRAALGLGPRERRRKQAAPLPSRRSTVALGGNPAERSAQALRMWNNAHDPHGTPVAEYLWSRELTLDREGAAEVVRYHPKLKLDGTPTGAMVALFRDVTTNEPCGIHRTFLTTVGRKLDRKMLGRAKHAAIKLDADENVTLGLTVGEGLETCLAARLAGFGPVWALGSASAIAAFPLLSGIEAITVLGEVGDGGANHRAAQTCAARWIEAGREAFMVEPQVGSDLNDVWLEVVR